MLQHISKESDLAQAERARPVLPLHPVISRFRAFSGEIPANCDRDFLGTIISSEFNAGLNPSSAFTPFPRMVENVPVPIHEETFEWIDLLESVVEARGTYTMIELGAGFGRWSVRAAFAVKQYNPKLRCKLVAVEPEPTVYGWMKKHFQTNGVSRWRHKLIHAAITEQPGKVHFYIGGPRGGLYDLPPDAWYGQFLTKDHDLKSEASPDGFYRGFQVYLHQSGWRSILVPGISLRTILKPLRLVDLLDVDIEGQELVALAAAAPQLDARVKRLHIGTHSVEIEAGLRELLTNHGWRCLADYSLFSTSETPWGAISFENGVQSWVNPRLM